MDNPYQSPRAELTTEVEIPLLELAGTFWMQRASLFMGVGLGMGAIGASMALVMMLIRDATLVDAVQLVLTMTMVVGLFGGPLCLLLGGACALAAPRDWGVQNWSAGVIAGVAGAIINFFLALAVGPPRDQTMVIAIGLFHVTTIVCTAGWIWQASSSLERREVLAPALGALLLQAIALALATVLVNAAGPLGGAIRLSQAALDWLAYSTSASFALGFGLLSLSALWLRALILERPKREPSNAETKEAELELPHNPGSAPIKS